MGDYTKLKRLGPCINSANDLKLTLTANMPLKLHCCVDVSYAVHVDSKDCAGNVVTLVTGAIF